MFDRINLWALGLVARVQAVREEDGQAMVEYALILALVSVVAAAVLKVTGTDIKTILNSINGSLEGA
jgi:Flp pilus assembly pilin Flp